MFEPHPATVIVESPDSNTYSRLCIGECSFLDCFAYLHPQSMRQQIEASGSSPDSTTTDSPVLAKGTQGQASVPQHRIMLKSTRPRLEGGMAA